MNNLKPCPFCGSPAELYCECDMATIRCSACGATTSGWWDETEEAIEDWNKRYSDVAALEARLQEAQDLMAMLINFVPTPENVNALPEGIRRYVHDLETKCDPAGDIQTIACLRDTAQGLELWAKEIQDENYKLQAENAALESQLALTEKALELACEHVADNDCPHEYSWAAFQKPECENCTHMTEKHQDTDRDTKCWKEFFIQQAKAGDSNS